MKPPITIGRREREAAAVEPGQRGQRAAGIAERSGEVGIQELRDGASRVPGEPEEAKVVTMLVP